MSEKDWNINKGFGDVLTNLIEDVNDAAKVGDTKLWFNSLRILYRNVAGHKKMKKEDREKLNKDLLEVRKKLDKPDSLTPKGKIFHQMQLQQAKQELDDINIHIITAMHQAGLILPLYKKRAEFGTLEI